MSRWLANLFILSLCLVVGLAESEEPLDPAQQLELKLNSLRLHKQLLQTEIGRIYMNAFTPETPLLLEELQQRQLTVQQQIEQLEGKAHQRDKQQLALSLSADFEYLQRKLDELKLQLDAIQTPNSSPAQPQQRDVVNSTPRTPASVGTHLFTPLLAMPETVPSVGVAAQPDQQATTPSLIKRLLAMLRPAGAAATASSASSGTLRVSGSWPEAGGKPLSAEELQGQLQLQRQFIDDAIKRLELLAAKQQSELN